MDEALMELAAAVRRGASSLDRRLRAERPADGLSLSKLSVLGHLRRRGPLTAGELAALDRVQPQSLTRTLTALHEDGLADRQTSPADRRQSVLRITEAGLAALTHDMQGRDTWLAATIAAELTPTEQALLRLTAPLLERLSDPA